eukprot:jgi/Chrzof1/14501/Cz09g05060.t1
MSGKLFGLLEIAKTDGASLLDAASNDVVLRSTDASQRLLIGLGCNVYSTGAFTSNAVTFGAGSSVDVLVSGRVVSSNATVSNLLAVGAVVSHAASNALALGCDANTATVTIAGGTHAQTINIGTGTGPSVIKLGAPGHIVNVAGDLTYIKTTNVTVSDKLMTLNKGGAAGSAAGVGFEIEEGGTAVGFVKTSSDRAGFHHICTPQ